MDEGALVAAREVHGEDSFGSGARGGGVENLPLEAVLWNDFCRNTSMEDCTAANPRCCCIREKIHV